MSETTIGTVQPAPVSARRAAQAGAADLRMLAQIEKWMATIRELNREQPAFQR